MEIKIKIDKYEYPDGVTHFVVVTSNETMNTKDESPPFIMPRVAIAYAKGVERALKLFGNLKVEMGPLPPVD